MKTVAHISFKRVVIFADFVSILAKMTTFERNEDCATVFLKWTDFRSRNHPFIRQQKDRVGIEKVWNCVDVIKVETTKMCDLIFYRFKARKMFEWCDSNSNISAVVVILLNFPIEYTHSVL